jgi:hypothetical protein
VFELPVHIGVSDAYVIVTILRFVVDCMKRSSDFVRLPLRYGLLPVNACEVIKAHSLTSSYGLGLERIDSDEGISADGQASLLSLSFCVAVNVLRRSGLFESEESNCFSVHHFFKGCQRFPNH